MAKLKTVAQLAREADLEADEALLALWDAGLTDLLEPDDRIPRGDARRAAAAVGVVHGKNVQSIAWWAQHFGISEDQLREQLSHAGFRVSPEMRRLPKGAPAKLRRMADPAPLAASSTSAVAVAPPKLPPFVWRTVGRPRSPLYLSEDDVLQIHWHLVEQFDKTGDPIFPPGVRDETLFSAAVSRPLTSHADVMKYPTAEMAAAALMHSLVLNHAFHNGNKRTALVSTLALLDRNDVALTAPEPEALQFVLRVAKRALVPITSDNRSDREVLMIADWICAHSRNFEHGDRPLQFRVLRKILRDFGCELWHPNGRGNRINIARALEERTLFGRTRTRRLETQIHYRNEGSDVARNTIDKLRHDLQLDEEHGCDSAAFYVSGVDAIDLVIAQYQTTLRRLARL